MLRRSLMLAVAGLATVQNGPTHAACPASRIFTSTSTSTYATSYVHTPGVCDSGQGCSSDIGSSITSRFRGSFWRLGAGDPQAGAGVDNGALAALDAAAGWIATYPSYPAFILGDWAADPSIDGCIDQPPDPSRCMALLLTDRTAGAFFAVLTAPGDAQGNFSFLQSGAAAIVLQPAPVPSIVDARRVGSTGIEVSVEQPAVVLDDHRLDPACDSVVQGYRLYRQLLPPGAPAPEPDGAGWQVASPPVPVSERVATVFDPACSGWELHLATALVLDSDFETPRVASSNRVVLGSCSDADCDGFCPFAEAPETPLDCDDDAADVFPGAPQVCDGLNNDCRHPHWPALIGTNEADDDLDGFRGCDGDCDDADPGISPAAAERCSGVDDDCDGLVDEGPEGQLDPDADGVAHACDVCTSEFDPAQTDLDGDGQGDACDIDDGRIRLRFDARDRLRWDAESGFARWNVYRGDLGLLRQSGIYTQMAPGNGLAGRFCDLMKPATVDPLAPPAGATAFYLTSGVASGAEGDLGVDGAGAVRPNTYPCP